LPAHRAFFVFTFIIGLKLTAFIAGLAASGTRAASAGISPRALSPLRPLAGSPGLFFVLFLLFVVIATAGLAMIFIGRPTVTLSDLVVLFGLVRITAVAALGSLAVMMGRRLMMNRRSRMVPRSPALAAGFAGLFRSKLMRSSTFRGGSATRRGNLSLLFRRHPGKSTLAIGHFILPPELSDDRYSQHFTRMLCCVLVD